MRKLALALIGLITMFGLSCPVSAATKYASTLRDEKPAGFPTATIAGGCFWCVEHTMRKLEGVLYTRTGYMGGSQETATYQDVSTGDTHHAEVVEVTFDPARLSYADLIRHFMIQAHDPTQKNRQGVDVGPQYRSVIFTHDADQDKDARAVIAALNKDGKIVTEITPAQTFWQAEDYHQRYYETYEKVNGRKHIRVLLKEKALP